MQATILQEGRPPEAIFQLIAAAVTLSGIYLGYVLYQRNKAVIAQWQEVPAMMAVRNFFFSGWKFDQLYHALFVKPFLFITRVNKMDVFDKLYNGIAKAGLALNRLLSVSQNGSLRWYIMGALIGILFIMTLVLV